MDTLSTAAITRAMELWVEVNARCARDGITDPAAILAIYTMAGTVWAKVQRP